MAGAHIPIPTETFLEELSVKMQLHPISVYWLLEELQAIELVHCLPEEKRLLEDHLSVLVELKPEQANASQAEADAIARSLTQNIKSLIGVTTTVRVVAPGAIERSPGKARRVIDKRPKG